jgi:hypothetical protein
MTAATAPPSLFAMSDDVRHRVTSALVDGFSDWWQMPLLVGLVATLVAFVLWVYRRDAVELPRGIGLLLAGLRLGAIVALVTAYLDLERTAEHEIVYPSRVAVLVDSSASMTLAEDAAAPAAETRYQRALDVLDAGGLLAALAPRHEVSIWRFDADAERLVTLPLAAESAPAGTTATGSGAAVPGTDPETPWREQLAPQGYETRLGEALVRVLDQEPPGALAGIVVLSDGANNAGIDPGAAATALAKADVPVHPLGIGSEQLPANVRVADLLVPSRVFPGDRFAVTGYLQAQGFAGTSVKVELQEVAAEDQAKPAAARRGRTIDVAESVLAADGELVAVRFDVPGLTTTGRHGLIVRVIPPAADTSPGDDSQTADLEVVERVTEVLLMAGGPSREYQFMRNVLERDKSFTVDVLLGTAAPGVSQDARRILDAFPATDEALAGYDAVVALDYDWRLLDPAAQTRLDRWVARESGGLVLAAGAIFMESSLSDPQTKAIRTLFPVEMRRGTQPELDAAGGIREPMPLAFTRDGNDAEFLWLASSRVASQTVWSGFPGVFSCFDATQPKPGATVYARAERPGTTGDMRPIYLCGQLYGSGSILYLGSGELWRLRSLDDALYERLAAQLVRHVSQGRLLRGSRRARLLVDRDRFPVGASIVLRVVEAAATAAGQGTLKAVAPDGSSLAVPLREEPARPGMLQGGFIAAQAGSWEITYTPAGGDDAVSRRIQVQLPDRELARPRLDRGILEQLALGTGGTPRLVPAAGWTPAESRAVADAIPDRSRREYETGAPDAGFKQRLNGILLSLGVGLLCLEWILRRLARLA